MSNITYRFWLLEPQLNSFLLTRKDYQKSMITDGYAMTSTNLVSVYKLTHENHAGGGNRDTADVR